MNEATQDDDAMQVFITSFQKSRELGPEFVPISVSVYQPKNFDYPVARSFVITDGRGEWVRPRLFVDYPEPLQAYRDTLWKLYLGRLEWIQNDINDWRDYGLNIALCCWCPYERAAQRQLKEFGSFVCHTSVVGPFLKERFDLPVWYDEDRRKNMVKLVRM